MYFIQKYTKKAIITTSDIFLFRYFVRECVQDKKNNIKALTFCQIPKIYYCLDGSNTMKSRYTTHTHVYMADERTLKYKTKGF